MQDARDALPLPPRYDPALAAGAAIGYIGLAVFLITQIDPGLRVSADARYGIVLWCMAVSGPGAICWLLRPHIRHLTYAMRLGFALAALPEPPSHLPPRRSIAGRRWFWSACGTIGACAWTLAGAIDIAVLGDKLDVHGAALDLIELVLCQVGAVCITVRVLGPTFAAVDAVYELARRDREDGNVLKFKRPGA